ncbi:TIGR03749 family integrating conjugative element protein [Variovorax sp. ZS18.2.2]|uniref:TIGR03749 family integrating conjugative element protein n=1 Tax=Variovorax sp. ZS18.2.2 TaxID=2971255 RepID=UPI002151F68D|nr:TIGR03749 family integrating conjugative element protein [Variovorax sp. ZS18.2.2]MCR6480988.1 TIGR03749 family integrating conjugative element protein [Variovorax sp. ZS18.2.2]
MSAIMKTLPLALPPVRSTLRAGANRAKCVTSILIDAVVELGHAAAIAAIAILFGIAIGICGAIGTAHAQEVRELSLSNMPPDLISDTAAPSGSMAPTGNGMQPAAAAPVKVDLGSMPVAAAGPGVRTGVGAGGSDGEVFANTPARSAARAAQGQRVGSVRRVNSAAPAGAAERAVFVREPIRVTLQVGRERLITLPAPAALHVPVDMESVARLEVIDRTIYARALVPFTPLRIVAELIDSGQQIPLDLSANAASTAAGELEVSVVDASGVGSGSGSAPAVSAAASDEGGRASGEPPAADMVQLTRHAARMLYAPRRLAWAAPNVHQVAVNNQPVNGLLRGVDVAAAPLGQWKSGSLYVTAVRVTNLSTRALELPLESMRGRWLAATAQHGRIGPKGSETDTTAVYLVCDRTFEACL